MADTNGIPRRVSMAYILGFSDKPYKEVRPPPPPPQARKSSQPVNMIPTPGRIMEWTASDGRKGKLTGAGKPRLTAASLAKVPSDKRSTKEALGAKSVPKKAASNKPTTDRDDLWGGNADWGNTAVKDGTKKSGSKQGDEEIVDNTGNANNDPVATTWGNTGDAPGGDDKNGGTNNLPADELPATNDTAGVPATTGTEDQQGDDDTSHGFTKEQDAQLLKWKAENSNKPWADFAIKIDKEGSQCKERFNQIKPKDWKPNASNQGGGGEGGEGKKAKNKEKNQNYHQNQGKGGNKKDEKKDGNKEGENKDENNADDPWGAFGNGFAIDADDDKKNDVNEANDTNNGGPKDATDAWDNKVEDGGTTGGGGFDGNKDTGVSFDAGDLWGPTAGVDAATKNSGTTKNQSTNNGGGMSQGFESQAWPTAPTPASGPASNKVTSRARPQHDASNNNTQPITTRPLELEVKPDATFSADDLRLVARILQQDCSMVWNRVSWRFRDKTGRTLHPNDFEKKITGHIESKDSEKDERRR